MNSQKLQLVLAIATLASNIAVVFYIRYLTSEVPTNLSVVQYDKAPKLDKNMLPETVLIPRPLPSGVKGYREVFFATDRQPVSGSYFANVASEAAVPLQYGHALVSIPETHTRGNFERPGSLRMLSVQFSEEAGKHIIIAERNLLLSTDFYSQLNQSIDTSPEHSAFVFIHGFNVSFDEAVLRTGQLAWDLQFAGPAVTYSWPSAHSSGHYVTDLDMADWTARHLTSFLRDLRARTGARTIHLVAHSMGSRILSTALDRLDGAPVKTPRFQEVVLAAPDVNNLVLNQLAAALRNESERVTLYASNRDWALQASAWLRDRKSRAGGDAAKLPPLAGFDIIDGTRAKGSLLGHSVFAEDTLLLNDLALLIKQRLSPPQRSITLEQTGHVWMLKP